VLGEKQYEAYVGDASGLGSLSSASAAKGLALQSLATVPHMMQQGAPLVVKGPRMAPRVLQLYGGEHWGGVGSEGYGTKKWDNSGWNAHYHPRDGASMDSESMEPYTWRKGPRVNDEYRFDDGGDPTVDPGKSWEPPIMVNGHEVYRGVAASSLAQRTGRM
jgi:hypothetical protein